MAMGKCGNRNIRILDLYSVVINYNQAIQVK